jgi:hypothetical protein
LAEVDLLLDGEFGEGPEGPALQVALPVSAVAAAHAVREPLLCVAQGVPHRSLLA